ncbi:MAG: hypothetical protein E6I03_11640 [Chloroflexi bacterium]|nr:MAG: hypothetical protein E6I03_11640 [Chloroflexota bacterium]
MRDIRSPGSLWRRRRRQVDSLSHLRARPHVRYRRPRAGRRRARHPRRHQPRRHRRRLPELLGRGAQGRLARRGAPPPPGPSGVGQ